VDIRQLRYFIAIAEERKISAAAKKLHIAQPPLSQQLKNLERELGVKLVERAGKELELTEAGHILYKHALKITQALEESQIEVKEMRNGSRGKLTIGVNTLSHEQLPSLLHQFKQEYPNITYKIQQNESAQLCKLVKERVIELAIIRLPLELDEFSVLYLHAEPFYFVTSNQVRHGSKEISYEQIQHYPLILPSTEGLGVYHMILEEFSRRELTANILCECSDITMLLQLVSSGFGASIVPEVVVKIHKNFDLQAFKILDTRLTASSGLIWLKNHYLSKAAQNFVDLIRNHSCGLEKQW